MLEPLPPFPSDEALRWIERWRRENLNGRIEAGLKPHEIVELEQLRFVADKAIAQGFSYEAMLQAIRETPDA